MENIEEKVIGILMDIWQNARIISLETPVCDIIVQFGNSSFKFAVEIKLKSDFSEEIFKNFTNNVAWSIFRQGAPRIPVVIALFDEELNAVEIGLAVSWHFGAPIICQNVSFKILSKNTSDIILDNIKAADEVIRSLEFTNCKVLKRISFNVPAGQIHMPGCMMYLRDLLPDYKMNCKKPQNQEEEFRRFLRGIPQEEYPRDEVDDIILESIASKYPDSVPHSSLLLFSSELRDIKEYINRTVHHKAHIMIYPSTDTSVLTLMSGTDIASLDLDIYMEMQIKGIVVDTFNNSSISVSSLGDYDSFKQRLSTVGSLSDMCL